MKSVAMLFTLRACAGRIKYKIMVPMYVMVMITTTVDILWHIDVSNKTPYLRAKPLLTQDAPTAEVFPRFSREGYLTIAS
jgi:hypothetical protein